MITVIEKSTQERDAETRALFEEIKPLLDTGMVYSNAVKQVKGLDNDYSLTKLGWYKELIKYGESQGYPLRIYSGKGGAKL